MNTEEKPTQRYNYELSMIEPQDPDATEPSIVYDAKRYSYADYLTWTDNKMREIIDGIVYAFSSPTRKHATAVRTLIVRAFNFIEKRKKKRKAKCEIYTAPFDVRLPVNGETDDDKIYNVLLPDICVICDPSKLEKGGCLGAPDLVVEVLSPSTKNMDLNRKFKLYERAGVKEYWVVDPINDAVTAFILQEDGKYDEGTLYETCRGATHVPVKMLEGLVIELKELFEI